MELEKEINKRFNIFYISERKVNLEEIENNFPYLIEFSKHFDTTLLSCFKNDKNSGEIKIKNNKIKYSNFFLENTTSHLIKNYFYYKKKFDKINTEDSFFFMTYPSTINGIIVGSILRNNKMVYLIIGDPIAQITRYSRFKIIKKLLIISKPIINFFYELISKYIFYNSYIFHVSNITIDSKNHINQSEIIAYSDFNKNKNLIKYNLKRKICFVGSENEQKGLIILLKALTLLNIDLELNIIGFEHFKNKMYLPYLEKFKINFHGKIMNRKKYYDLLSNNDLLIMPSFGEKQGRVQLEAMSVGVVPICSDGGGTYRTITNFYNGLLFKEGSFKDLANKINLIYENNLLWLKLKENGILHIKDCSLEKEMEKVSETIKNFYFH